jgi:hypothetical protein
VRPEELQAELDRLKAAIREHHRWTVDMRIRPNDKDRWLWSLGE